jgi:hypothetical protein
VILLCDYTDEAFLFANLLEDRRGERVSIQSDVEFLLDSGNDFGDVQRFPGGNQYGLDHGKI